MDLEPAKSLNALVRVAHIDTALADLSWVARGVGRGGESAFGESTVRPMDSLFNLFLRLRKS